MATTLLQKLEGQREKANADRIALMDRYADSEDENGIAEFSEADKANFDALNESIAALDERIAALVGVERSNMEHTNRLAGLDGERSRVQVNEPARVTLGEQFAACQQFADYKARGAQGASNDYTVSEFSLITSKDAAGKALAGVQRVADAALPQRTTPLLDAIGYEAVSRNQIEWIEWPLTAPTAGEVAEGAEKPEAEYPPVIRSGSLFKAAHHIPMTEEFIEDAPRLKSIVEGALLDGVKQKMEAHAAQVTAGGAYPTVSHDSLLKAIRVAYATVETGGFRPTVVLLNPLDYADIDIDLLTLTLNGAQAETRPWGLQYVAAGAVAQGDAYVADARTAWKYLDRRNLSLSITDSHAEEFVENIYRMRAEARGLVIVQRPEAACKATVGDPAAAAKTVKAAK